MRRPRRRATPTVDNFRDDPLYPRIVRAVDQLLAASKVVAPIDVLVAMGLLRPTQVEAWRGGRVPYLERVLDCTPTRVSRLLRILRFHAHDLNLVPTISAYSQRGGGAKRRLRFTRSGERKLEEAYARHFVWPGKRPFQAEVGQG